MEDSREGTQRAHRGTADERSKSRKLRKEGKAGLTAKYAKYAKRGRGRNADER